MDLTGERRERLKVIDAEYTVEEEGHNIAQPVVHLFCRDEDRNRRQIDVEGFRPYFMLSAETFADRPTDIINDRHVLAVRADLRGFDTEVMESQPGDPEALADALTAAASETRVYHDENVATALDGTELVQVYTHEPAHVGKIRDHFERTWEADVPFERRFLISSGIHRGISIPEGADRVRYENWPDHSSSDTEIQEIRPADPPDVDPRMLVVDIEVATHGGGVPDPIDANNEITAITAYDNYTGEYAGWVLESDHWDGGVGDFESSIDDRLDVEMETMAVHDHEGGMLEDFHNWVLDRDVDLVTGWNSNWFDYPYIINRSYEISAYSIREWSVFGNPGAWRTDNDEIQMSVKGMVTFDMLDAYRKTQFRDLRSYSLEYVAQTELGMGKEQLGEDLDDAWHHHPVDFMVYNVRDVQAVVEIEQQRGLLALYDNMRKVIGSLYTTCNSNGPMLDTLFLRVAYEDGIALTTNYKPDQGDYHGAHVFDPVPGIHDTVVYPDLASLYPYILWTLNISPETMYTSREAYRESGFSDDEVFTAYIDDREWKVVSSGDTIEPASVDKDRYKGIHDETGSRKKKTSQGFDGIFDPLDPDHPRSKTEIYFVKPDVQEGFIRQTVDMLVDLKYEYKDQPDMYGAVKRITNSLYGVLGDSASGGKGFRLFDWRLGEAITLAGQSVIQFTADEYVRLIDQYAEQDGYEPNTYLVGGDTDSVQTAIPQAPDYETALDWAERASEQVSGPLYDEFMEQEFDVIRGEDEHKMDVEIESLASSLFFIADEDDPDIGVKKRYAQHEIWDENDGWLHEDLRGSGSVSYADYEDGVLSDREASADVDITGFEYVRSDSATVTQEAQQRVLTDVLLASNPADEIYSFLSSYVEDIRAGEVPAEKLGRPKGISNKLDDYGWKTVEELAGDSNYTVTQDDEDNGGRYVATPGPTYRGAKYADDHLDWEDISEGSKPVRFYVDKVRGNEYPPAYTYDSYPKDNRPDPPEVGRLVDAIAVDDPARLPDDFVLDRDKMIEKELEDKIQPILRTIGEDWDGLVGQGRQVGLDQWS